MYKHIKYTCKQNKDEDLKELVRLLNMQLEQKDKEIAQHKRQLESQMRQLETHFKQIDKLATKLEINGSFNTTNIQNNIQLLSFKDTDCSHLTDKDYAFCIRNVNFCVKSLIEKIHFNPEKPENMNIYISNMKDKYITVYDGSNWNLANKNEELTRLYEEKEQMLEEWLEINPNPMLKEKFIKYLNNKESDDCLQHIMEEIKLMMYNKGNQKRIE
jgi:exonuclease VII large subunit